MYLLQKLGKDSILPVGGETAESREQWAEDMDTDVSTSFSSAVGKLTCSSSV